MAAELDLVFICDATGSMGSYLSAAQQNINSVWLLLFLFLFFIFLIIFFGKKIVAEIAGEGRCDVRFALVQYRDHPPEDSTFVVQASAFTASVAEMKAYVDVMFASGGGDGPEAVADGLRAAHDMAWREGATKVVCLIADAPPHGLEPAAEFASDGFPDGCPCGSDPLQVAHAMSRRGITVYCIGAEPALSSYYLARDFLRAVARITAGQFLPLSSASLLAATIVGGALEELELTSLMGAIRLEATQTAMAAPGATRDDVARAVTESLQRQQVTTTHLVVDDIYAGQLKPLDPAWVMCPNVLAARAEFGPRAQKIEPRITPAYEAEVFGTSYTYSAVPPPAHHHPAAAPAADDGDAMDMEAGTTTTPTTAAPQSASIVKGAISYEQVSRAIDRGVNMGLY